MVYVVSTSADLAILFLQRELLSIMARSNPAASQGKVEVVKLLIQSRNIIVIRRFKASILQLFCLFLSYLFHIKFSSHVKYACTAVDHATAGWMHSPMLI